jgi:hypothetical protein
VEETKEENGDQEDKEAKCVMITETPQSHGSSGHDLHLQYSYITAANFYRMLNQ